MPRDYLAPAGFVCPSLQWPLTFPSPYCNRFNNGTMGVLDVRMEIEETFLTTPNSGRRGIKPNPKSTEIPFSAKKCSSASSLKQHVATVTFCFHCTRCNNSTTSHLNQHCCGGYLSKRLELASSLRRPGSLCTIKATPNLGRALDH